MPSLLNIQGWLSNIITSEVTTNPLLFWNCN